jgi:hypothetical protein
MTTNWMNLAALAAMADIYVYEPSISARSLTFVHSQLLKIPRPNASPPWSLISIAPVNWTQVDDSVSISNARAVQCPRTIVAVRVHNGAHPDRASFMAKTHVVGRHVTLEHTEEDSAENTVEWEKIGVQSSWLYHV